MSASPYQPPPPQALDPIFADAQLVVVNKPAGLLSVPGRGEGMDDCMARRVQAEYPDALIVHRLDMSTSGLLVLARGAAVHRALSIAFQSRAVKKRYVAVVAGRLALASGEIDLPLICDWPNRPRQIVDRQIGKPSLTHYRVLAYDATRDYSRVELEPITGRSHQLRVHLQQLGHPILGDDLYAPEAIRTASPRLLLHAEWLEIPHPASELRQQFESTAPF